MPFTNGETVSYGSGVLPVYWCSYGCKRGHCDPVRIADHEEAVREGPHIVELQASEAGHLRFECGVCHMRGEQPFDIAIHKCPLSVFECDKRAPEPRQEPKKKRQLSTASTDSSSSTTSL